ncbi:hypothetical protein B0H12DRAFT_1069081 [Mycena haematopus]|nr:hypothetical protein B0H12DRAFT_1069081 [Mycena haematopus]
MSEEAEATSDIPPEVAWENATEVRRLIGAGGRKAPEVEVEVNLRKWREMKGCVEDNLEGLHRSKSTQLGDGAEIGELQNTVISRAGGRTKSGRNGLGSDTGIKTEGVKVQDGNMVNLCDTTQVATTATTEDGAGGCQRADAERREVKGQTPIDAGGRRAAKGGSPEDEWWKI